MAQQELSDWDRRLYTYFGKKSPIVPLGCVITAGILCSGFYHFKAGNKRTSNIMMRARVVSQGVTVSLMMFSIFMTKRQRELGIEL
mmetsp:Transcript_45953/g.121953  ORF Transcript_45953/g.121953 Transcript_45953/m.121953 type:complete len:86 (-) Transcript_45953:173-430(-)|eukprot:CAMPEP_0113661582 /NCGR_PEP_ID=MMETSP0038_2-20120614/55_1 /TAXON_ID=2898 /ORGANISM="Cryptomonas paramecium" /LENGTH=85 /DNA_ID=CAMNT_0000576291 /DNA_START=23 /DNA_END=280 /DNA_ORIENTATION=- /assembly_acc=CAM_ASM_000170